MDAQLSGEKEEGTEKDLSGGPVGAPSLAGRTLRTRRMVRVRTSRRGDQNRKKQHGGEGEEKTMQAP